MTRSRCDICETYIYQASAYCGTHGHGSIASAACFTVHGILFTYGAAVMISISDEKECGWQEMTWPSAAAFREKKNSFSLLV